jgi:hypothetical protein
MEACWCITGEAEQMALYDASGMIRLRNSLVTETSIKSNHVYVDSIILLLIPICTVLEKQDSLWPTNTKVIAVAMTTMSTILAFGSTRLTR